MSTSLLERLTRPGVLGLAGRAIEKRCQDELESYFRKLGAAVKKLNLEELAGPDRQPDLAKHTAVMRLNNVVRHQRPVLTAVLTSNISAAVLLADKLDPFSEADAKDKTKTAPLQIGQIIVTAPAVSSTLDRLGITGQEAAEYAAAQAAKQIVGIDQTTIDILSDVISRGITEMKGVPGTARMIRQVVSDMSVSRARTIASTEINDAMSEAALRKLKRIGVAYKQWILSPDACPICEAIAENADERGGAIPVDEDFEDDDGETYSRPPAHPNCRCAVTGARAPEEKDEQEQ